VLNRLSKEKSPYLRQHANNPVDWYPWGSEAFDAAKAADKPVFLSIGYATCHWCHVMEGESFQNPEIAALLNRSFICIKVDREEHPEVDSIYMDLAQALMASPAGWPLNLFLTPDMKPFFAMTYMPAKPSPETVSLPEVLEQIQLVWAGEERGMVVQQAKQIVEAFAHTANATGAVLPSEESLKSAANRFFDMADPINGGMKGAPKFPLSYQSEFLLGEAKKEGDGRGIFYVELSFEMMRRGGIYDQIGGGFSRYSTDEKWAIPHFEKMLYDNALLAKSYLQAWKFTKKEIYGRICKETLDYLLRDLVSPEGGLYSGEDADSEGREGAFYTWTPFEVQEVLPGEEGELFCDLYDVTHAGNFEGRNVLRLENGEPEFAASFNLDFVEFQKKVAGWKVKMLQKRDLRPRPFRDEKIVPSCSGLAIDALIRAGASFQEERYTEGALKAAAFIRRALWSEGKLVHRWCDGEARFPAILEDYAGLIKGVLSLYEEGFGADYLDWAIEMAKVVERDFKEIEGAFYQTDGKDTLIFRKCDFYDGASPSGNGLHTENLLRLYQITRDENYLRQAEDTLKAAKQYMESVPFGAAYHLLALSRYLDTQAPVIVVALNQGEVYKEEIRRLLSTQFLPTGAVVWKKMGDLLCPENIPLQGETTVYICRQNRCEAPLTKLEEIAKVIEKL